MDTPQIKKESNFWKNNGDTIISIAVVISMMVILKYLFAIALHSKLS